MSAAPPSPQRLLGESDIQTSVHLQASELRDLDEPVTSTRRRTAGVAGPQGDLPATSQNEAVDSPRHPYTATIRRWWSRHVAVAVPIQYQRDHLALERTFLGYIRTSIAFSMVGVIIAQLFRLQHSIEPSEDLGFFKAGVPLATVFEAMAILVALLGAWRFWRQQHAMLSGTIWASGWEIVTIMVLSSLLCIGLFVLILTIGVMKGDG